MSSSNQPQEAPSLYTKSLGDFMVDPTSKFTGSFGIIYKACLKVSQINNVKWAGIGTNVVAIKVMPNIPDKQDDIAKDVVKSELLAASRLPRHPGLMQIYNYFQIGDFLCIVCEFCGGNDLYEKGMRDRNFDEKRLQRAMRDVTGGLLALLNSHLYHRDIKPENLMLIDGSSTSRVKVVDYGFLFLKTNQQLEPRYLSGTLRYFAPEQIRKHLKEERALFHPNLISEAHAKYMTYVNEKTEVWALGMNALKIAAHSEYFVNRSFNTINLQKQYRDLYTIDLHAVINGLNVSPECKEWLKGTLRLNPSQRFTIKQAREHPWIKDCTSRTPSPRPRTQTVQRGISKRPTITVKKNEKK